MKHRNEYGGSKGLVILILLAMAGGLYWMYMFGNDLLDFQAVQKTVRQGCQDVLKRGGGEAKFYQFVQSDLSNLGITYLEPQTHFYFEVGMDGTICSVNYKLSYTHPFVKKTTTKRYKWSCTAPPGDWICKH